MLAKNFKMKAVIENQKMVSVNSIVYNDDKVCINGIFYNPDDVLLLRYLDAQDATGDFIFEGDIIRIEGYDEPEGKHYETEITLTGSLYNMLDILNNTFIGYWHRKLIYIGNIYLKNNS